MTSQTQQRARFRCVLGSPALRVLVVAPLLGEGLSGSSPPLELLVPWKFAYMVALYGCGALVCREVAHRFDLGLRGLVLLAAAYGVWEEALVDRYWFYPQFWKASGVGDYSVVWHTNVLLAVHLTVFHTTISICCSVVVVEGFIPQARLRPWASSRGLVVAGLVLAGTPLIYGEFAQRPPLLVLAAAALLLCTLVAAAFASGRRDRLPRRIPPSRLKITPRPFPRGLSWWAFGCALTHWALTYTVAYTGLPWSVGVGLALLPVVFGVVVVPRLVTSGGDGRDAKRVVVGLLAFFVLLDLLVAILGRYDMVLSAVGTAWLARRLSNQPAGG